MSWVYKVNSANVNIKKSADLNAANNLTLAAKADFSNDLTAELPDSSTKGINAIPLAAVTFGYYDNSAKINVDGKIEAGKDLKLTADTITTVKQKATAQMKEKTGVDSPDKGKTYIGLSIAVGNTTSEINLNRKETINAGGNFTAAATATPTIDVSSSSDLSFDDTGSIGTSFNFINDDSNVNVNVNSSINSGGKVDISAKQTISDTMVAENTLGKGDNYFAKANYNYDAWTNGYTFADAIKNRIKDKTSGLTYDRVNNTKTAATEGFSSEAFMSLVDGSQFKAGSVGGYFGQVANTNVKIADNVKITAKNDVNINANTEITKLALSSVSSVYSANNAGKTDQSTERTVSMASTVSNIRNNAKVDMGGNITTSGGSVNVNLLNNRATVVGNNNLTINADKNVTVNSKADTSTVTITGEGGMLGTLSKSYGKSMGLDVNYQNVNGNALVMLGEANIVGKNSVNIGSNNDLLQVSIMNGASTAEGSNMHGMINVVTGNSNAVNLVNNASNISAGKNLNVTANQKANAYDINGSLNLAKESSENNVGVGFTWLDIDSNSVANVVPFAIKNNSDSLQKAVNADIKNNVKLASDMAKNAGATAPKATSDKGSLTGEIINVNADSSGNLLSIVAEGSYSTNSDSGLNKTVEGISKFGGIVSSGSKLLEKYLNAPVDKLNKTVGNYLNPSEKPPEMKPFTDPIARTLAPVPTDKHLSSANAIAFRWGYSNSSAILDNLNIKNGGDNSQLNLFAGDNSFRGAFSGSASANIFSGDKVNHASQKSFNSGVALNVGSNNVKSVLSNSTVDKSALITNVAQNSGSDVATGLSAGINSATGAGKQNAITLDISVNNSKNNVHAFQINNTVTGNNAALTNYAFNEKIQVAGGIGTHFSRGGQGGSNGSVSGSYSDITNDLQSGIHGGKYSGLSAADVQAAKAQLQINSAIGLGRSSSSADNKSNEGSFTAAVAWQKNTSNAFINNADITATGKGNSPILKITEAQDTDKYKAFHHYADRNATTEIFKNSNGLYYSRDYAKETYVKSNNDYVKATDSSDGIRYVKVGNSYVQAAKDSKGYYTTNIYFGDIFVRFNNYNGGVNVLAYETKNNSSWNKYLTDRGFDLQGSDTLADDAKAAAGLPDLRSGSTNVNVAGGVNSTANLAGSIGVAFDYDSDSLSSQLNNNTIAAHFINADTRRNLDNINVATGVLHTSDKNSWAGGGSISFNILKNSNTVNLTDNKIKTDNFNSTVHNNANIVNVAGQGAWAGSAAVGAVAAINSMDNTASSIINGGSFNRLTDNGSINLKINVLNDTASTAIAAAASKISDGAAVNTSFAMNFGKNSTEAVVDKSKKSAMTIDNAQDISIKATDRNTKVTIGGTVDYTKGAASVGATYVHSGDTNEKLRADNQSKNLNMGGIMSATSSDFNVGLGAVWNRLRQNTIAEFAFDKPSDKTSTVGNFDMQALNYSSINSWAGGVQFAGFEGMDFEVKIGKLNDNNELTGAANTGVTIADGTKIDAANFTVNATNVINTQKNKKYGANIDAWLTPVLGGAWAKSDEAIKRTTSIDIGKNVNVTTTGEQIYEAGTETRLDNTATGITWGAIGGGRVTASTVGDFANSVKVGEGSKFTTTDTGDLTFATYDDIISNVYSQSKYKGAVGTDLVSNAVNKVTRKNTVDIAKGTTLNSANDLNLYSGATYEGHLSELISSTTSEASNGSLAISTSPQIDITADSTNELKINGDAKAKADLNLIADKGTESVTKRAVKYSFGEESDKGQIPVRRTVEDAKHFNYSNKNTSAIEVNGAASAGNSNNVEVKISGTAARSDKPTYKVEFTDGNGKTLDGYKATTGSFNYAQTLAARWNELQELIGIYTAKTGNVTMAQYAGYVQELALLESKMTRLGLLETKNGKKTLKTESVNVNYVELPNISVSGGTVNITTPNLKGTGSIVANSNPYVGIFNSSNAWLRVNDLATKNAGNGIIFNDAKITDNRNIGGVKLSANDSKKSGVTIDNSGASTKDNGVPNIEIAGLIDASNRNVTIKNPNGDITVNASINGKETGINGRTVNITSNGDLLHGYTSGTVHIGTAPEDLYKKEVEEGATRMGKVKTSTKARAPTAISKRTAPG